jgi:hypothetical protein
MYEGHAAQMEGTVGGWGRRGHPGARAVVDQAHEQSIRYLGGHGGMLLDAPFDPK